MAPNDVLECGASLAEREYSQDLPKIAAKTESSSVDSAESLRNLLASNVLNGSSSSSSSSSQGTAAATTPTFKSPFEVPLGTPNPSGNRFFDVPLVYCDQTASNRPVQKIERYLQNTCLPLYGNTHTNTSITGSQSTAFVAEARQIVAEETNAKITGKASLDVVLFAGNGATSAVELLIDCLGLAHACSDDKKASRPVVFVGPYEHHSNLIPWRESGCEIVMIPECAETKTVDLKYLERTLQKPEYQNRLTMGTFSAASNVTGKVSDTNAIAATLHRHGALAFFDYATGAPYMEMNMNPPAASTSNGNTTTTTAASLVAKDAIFLSPHKMYGGVGTPGVLILKKHLVSQTNAPRRAGGGTVFYVTNTHHRFLSNRIERYEGGTPNVVGIMRVGLTFLLKRQADQKYAAIRLRDSSMPPTLQEYEYATYDRIAAQLKRDAPNLVLLGGGDDDETGKKLPIFSFLIRCGDRFLHYNYVCAILNDLFGIQSRGGCQCAGPYSQRLLGLTTIINGGSEVPNTANSELEEALLKYKERAELLRPGYTRLSLPFKGLRSDEVEYVVQSLCWVSHNAWALMCQYGCNHRTGEWRHHSRQGKPLGRLERRWLSHFDIHSTNNDAVEYTTSSSALGDSFGKALKNADAVLKAAKLDQRSLSQAMKMRDADVILGGDNVDGKLEELRWYIYPKEVARMLENGETAVGNGALSGAINPFSDGTTAMKIDEEIVSNNDAKGETVPSEHNAQVAAANDDSTKLLFRDGEHSGEATLGEIKAGVDDGELSDATQIFDSSRDCWISLDDFLTRTNESVGHQETVVEDSVGDNLQSSTTKKATRDPSTWGTGTAVEPERLKPNKSEEVKTPAASGSKRSKTKHIKPPTKMMKLVTNAMVQWEMVKDGDRLLLGLSGGKDSLSLLHCLMEFKRKLPINFEIEVCTIDPMTPSFDPSPLIPYVESLGLKYHYIREDIVNRAASSGRDGQTVSSLCAYCARMKRGSLYNCARKNNCNKLVLAQHLDDCAESCFMSLMHNGFLRTMKANYQINAGDISVIRPLVYCRESLMTEFAKSNNLPVINENCPACFEEPKERARVKKLLGREETLYPNFYDNVKRALIPLMHDDLQGIIRCYTEDILSKSKRHKNGKRKRTSLQGSVYDAKMSDEQENAPDESSASVNLSEASEEQLVLELARRKADKFRLAGAMKRVQKGPADEAAGIEPQVQVCTTSGGCTIFD